MTEPSTSEQVLRGIPVSLGIEIGPAFVIQEEGFHLPTLAIDPSEVDGELERLDKAWETTIEQIKGMRESQGEGERQLFDDILEIHLMLANDIPIYIGSRVEELVRGKLLPVETAFHQALNELLERLSKSPLQRSEDVADIGDQVLRNLVGRDAAQFDEIEAPVIVVAEDLSPSMTVRLPKDKVLAFATTRGSRSSHTAIMARSLEIPAVVGLADLVDHVTEGDLIIIDGDRGQAILRPTPETVSRFNRLREAARQRVEAQVHLRELQAETRDGYVIHVQANIELPEEVEAVIEHGGHGIGLYRSEFLFLNRDDLPNEEEQFLAYRAVVEAVAPDPVTLRTLDIGGDKFLSSLRTPREMNPFMGWRAIRFCLQQPEIFHTQLRAILRASAFGNLSIMFPMISEIRELALASEALERVREELRREGEPFNELMEVGAMIEVPSAALVIEGLAPMVDFFSIGTNDLIQYTLAVDRGNERTAYLYDPLHPGVLRLIKEIVEKAHSFGKRVCMCGEMAGEIEFTLILVGLMLDEVSMSPISIPTIKRLIRSISLEDAVPVAEEALRMTDPSEIRSFLRGKTLELAPWTVDYLPAEAVSASA
ncbi:MAG: phosphoenolpyruvate--protein phosphotransferase [Candidatus Omnitrophica bacterium]|nr:phosphoenolpyruvate--protein phosphotransferase [Candidatus Omnitrophota bacterium]